jgi:hypothetical protein
MANGSSDSFTSGLEEALQARESLVQDYADRESGILAKAQAERAQQTIYWENLITQTTLQAQSLQMKSYAASAKSMAKSLGAGIREQALLMIPFEVAEATKEFARFLSTGDPLALASSLQHALAVKQYAEAAGGGGHQGGGGGAGGGGAGGTRSAAAAESAEAEPSRSGRIIIEGALRDSNEQITLTGEQLYQIVDGLNAKWKEGSIVLDFAR